MLAMYVTFVLSRPVRPPRPRSSLLPLVVGALMFIVGAFVYRGRRAAMPCARSVNIRHGADLLDLRPRHPDLQGLRAVLLHARLPATIKTTPGSAASTRGCVRRASTCRGRSCSAARCRSLAFGGLYLMMSAHRLRPRARSDARRQERGRARRHRSATRCSRIGWGLGAAQWSGVAGAVLASFYYAHPPASGRRRSRLIAYITVALGGFGSVFGALWQPVIIVGLVEARDSAVVHAILALKSMGIYVLYLHRHASCVRSGLFGKPVMSAVTAPVVRADPQGAHRRNQLDRSRRSCSSH